jgi:hypothetical protein
MVDQEDKPVIEAGKFLRLVVKFLYWWLVAGALLLAPGRPDILVAWIRS